MKTFFEETLERVGLCLSEYGERITIFGFCGICVEGHKGLEDFSPEYIVLKLKKRKIHIRGNKLSIKEITADELFINGKITALEVENDK